MSFRSFLLNLLDAADPDRAEKLLELLECGCDGDFRLEALEFACESVRLLLKGQDAALDAEGGMRLSKTHTPAERRAVRYGSQGPLHPCGHAVAMASAAERSSPPDYYGLTPKAPAGAPAKAGDARSGLRPRAEFRAGRVRRKRAPCRCCGPPP